MSDVTSITGARDRRWLILGVISLAQVMVIMSLTVMNIALRSALLSTIFAAAVTSYLTAHLAAARIIGARPPVAGARAG